MRNAVTSLEENSIQSKFLQYKTIQIYNIFSVKNIKACNNYLQVRQPFIPLPPETQQKSNFNPQTPSTKASYKLASSHLLTQCDDPIKGKGNGTEKADGRICCHFNVVRLEGWFSLLRGQNIKTNVLKTPKQSKAIQKAWHPGKIYSSLQPNVRVFPHPLALVLIKHSTSQSTLKNFRSRGGGLFELDKTQGQFSDASFYRWGPERQSDWPKVTQPAHGRMGPPSTPNPVLFSFHITGSSQFICIQKSFHRGVWVTAVRIRDVCY